MSNPISIPNKTRTRPSVLVIVDDEPAITSSLQSFFNLETDYQVHTFQSPIAALAALPRIRPDIVISDFLMAEMDGIRFLAHVRQLDRDIPLILLTGYADKENAIRAINEIGIYHYFEKPWDNDALKLTVENGLQQRNLTQALRTKIRELDLVMTRLTSLKVRDELLRGELEMARRMQAFLLPASPPHLPGLEVESHYLPLIEIGGDFFDFHVRGEEKLDVLVADVAGHGIQAALIAAMVKAVFNECATGDLTPAATLDHMNSRLGELLPAGRFVTAVAVSIDLRRHKVRVANAGHPPPIWLSPRLGRHEALSGGSLPLAILEPGTNPPYTDVEITPERGDSLFLYTDGLADLSSATGERFGDREFGTTLERVLQVPAGDSRRSKEGSPIGALVLAAAQRFAAGQAPVDDINIVAVTFER